MKACSRGVCDRSHEQYSFFIAESRNSGHVPAMCSLSRNYAMASRTDLVFERDLVGTQMASVLVVLEQQSDCGAWAAEQELHVQHLQLVHSDVEGFMKPHCVHRNHLSINSPASD